MLFTTRLIPDNELKLVVKAYNKLLEVRKNGVGFLISEGCVEDKDVRESLEEQYASLALDTRLGRSSIRNTYIKLFKKGYHYAVKAMLKTVSESTEQYMHQTNRRSRYGIIAPMAFCDESDIPRHLGNSNPVCNLEQTWRTDFQQLCPEGTDTGLLEVLGVSRSELIHWWTDGQPDAIREDTRVWRDVKNLALKLVRLFDRIGTERDISSSSVALDDRGHQHGLKGVIPQLKKVSQNLFRLLYIRQSNVGDILPLYEMLVPVVYAFTMTLSLQTEEWKAFGSEITAFLEAYVTSLSVQRDALIMQLGAVEEMKMYDNRDSYITTSSQQLARGSGLEFPNPRQTGDITALREETMDALKRMGLCEKRIIITQKQSIGGGSFAEVFKCREEHSCQELAVKFLKLKPNDPERVQNRLLREAKIWIKLRDDKFNELLGFCVSPDEDFPGLISPYREWTLATYLKAHEHTASNSEKLCYLYEIACALDHMHKHEDQLVHGDLRPPNVLLVPDQFGNGYNAILTDFGVSYADEDVGYDLTTLQHTNYRYLAPELLTKESGKERMVTIEGDIYSFGCVFLEVMYNVAPFDYGLSIDQLRREKKGGRRLPVAEETIQKHHWGFLKKTWDAKPQDRPLADDVVYQMYKFKLM